MGNNISDKIEENKRWKLEENRINGTNWRKLENNSKNSKTKGNVRNN